MAMKKRANPLFLEFINYPIKKSPLIIKDNGEFEFREDDPEFNEMRDRIKNCLKHLIKNCTLRQNDEFEIKKEIEHLNNCSEKYLEEFIAFWYSTHTFINNFVTFPMEKVTKQEGYTKYIETFGPVDPILTYVTPVLHWKDTGGYEIELQPFPPQFHDSEPIPDLFGIIRADAGNFILNHYREGIFADCKLYGCFQIIITTNGRKYCCDSHKTKASNERGKQDSDKGEYKRIYGRLSKKYYRYGLKTPLKEFVKKRWPPEKQHLYDRFSRFAK